MGSTLQTLIFIIIGIVLFWFGYTLFFGPNSPFHLGFLPRRDPNRRVKGRPGDPQVCPVCSTILFKGDLVKTQAFPSSSDSTDRKMYIRGCENCLDGQILRLCPVCKIELEPSDFLVSRMFERRRKKNHIHIVGCNHCKKVPNIPSEE